MNPKKPTVGEAFVFYVGPALVVVFMVLYLVATRFWK